MEYEFRRLRRSTMGVKWNNFEKMTKQLTESEHHREYILSFLVDSSTNEGAFNVSVEGSRFSIILETPIVIPKQAFCVSLKVKQVNLYHVNPNISVVEGNNLIRVTYLAVDYDITIPTGLYDHMTLYLKILQLLRNASSGITPMDLFYFLEDPARQGTVIQFNYADTTIDFSFSTLGNDLGFESIPYTNAFVGPQPSFQESPNKENLRKVEYYLIKCSDLIHTGLLHNQSYSSILARVEIDHEVGDKIIYEPAEPLSIPCNELVGAKITKMTFLITDQFDKPLDLNGEDWSMVFELYYRIMDKDAKHEPSFH